MVMCVCVWCVMSPLSFTCDVCFRSVGTLNFDAMSFESTVGGSKFRNK